MEKLEKGVADLEAELAAINEQLRSPEGLSTEANKKLIANWQLKDNELKSLMAEWEKQHEILDELESKLS